MKTNRFLVNDVVIMEDVCNASCKYCITASSNFKPKHDLVLCEEKLDFHLEKLLDDENSYHEGSQLKERLDRVTEILKNKAEPLILKISGGEIFLIKGIQDYIQKQAPLYKRIQVLTNGILLNNALIASLADIPNLSFQISMDGHTMELNGYRIKSQGIQDKLLKVLELLAKYNIKTEINCVLTDKNIEGIYDFASYLKQYSNILLLPYPIRGNFREQFFPGNHQLSAMRRLIEEYESFEHILPPLKYLNTLEEFLSSGKRSGGCCIPSIIYQSFDDGIVSPCPNIWFKSFGNILEDEEKVISQLSSDPFYILTNRKQPVLELCKYCYTPWDILNLFFSGDITLEDLSKIHLYNDPEILSYLQGMSREIKRQS